MVVNVNYGQYCKKSDKSTKTKLGIFLMYCCGPMSLSWFDIIFWIYVGNLALCAQTGQLAPVCH